jgi:dienelactone hydrolase
MLRHTATAAATACHVLGPACRLIADVFADNGFLTVVPDYFHGGSVSNSNSWPTTCCVFGHACRLIADVFADSGFLTLVPDYFQGEPMNIGLLETYEALPSSTSIAETALKTKRWNHTSMCLPAG